MQNRSTNHVLFTPALSSKKHVETDYDIGEVMGTPAPSPRHQWTVQNILCQLRTQTEHEFLYLQAPCDLIISNRKIHKPDLMIIQKERRHIIEEHAVTSPPDIIIEVLSKSSIPLDRRIKMRDYAQFGVHEYWIVDPYEQCIEQYVRTSDTYVCKQTVQEQHITSAQFDQLSCQLSHIFPIDS